MLQKKNTVMAQKLKCATVNATVVASFRHTTRNASRIRWKLGHESVLMRTKCLNTRFLVSLPAMLCEGGARS